MSSPPAPAMHLLFVDDDRINLMLFEAACAALPGVRVSTAASGAEALGLARNDPPQLLVIDLHLPDTDGYALLHALRRDAGAVRGAGLPVHGRRQRRSAPGRGRCRLCRLLGQADRRPEPAPRAGGVGPCALTGMRRLRPTAADARSQSAPMSFRSEPPFKHGSAARVGVLLVNLGTPDAPTPAALRRYLAEFLSDPRVVEIPRLLWWLILHGVILRVRPAKSALKYAAIWTPEGSPLAVWTAKQAKLLLGYLGQAGHPVLVRHAMRYGKPSIADEMDALRAEGATRVLVLPLYPQYSAATSASVFDAVAAWGQRSRWVPELRFVQQYHDDPGYIDALAAQVRAHWQREGRGRCW